MVTRVRLKVDLTRYHPAFKAGVEGEVAYRPGQLDQFFVMRLDDGSSLDVLWKSVDVVDEMAPFTPDEREYLLSRLRQLQKLLNESTA